MQKIAEALMVFRGNCPPVAMDKTNPFHGSKYAGLAGILKTIRPALEESGLSVLQFPHSTMYEGFISIGCRTTLLHSSGEFVQHDWVLPPMKQDPQAGMAALTYARRGSLAAVLGLVIEDDDGGIDPAVAGAGNHPPRSRKRIAPAMSEENRTKLKLAADIRIGELGDEEIKQKEVIQSVAAKLGTRLPSDLTDDQFGDALSAVQTWEPGA